MSYSHTQTKLATGSSLSYPYRVAVDASGNVYVANTQANSILKESYFNGSVTESVVLGTGLATPYGVAVDGSGNVYIADSGHNRVLKMTPSGAGYNLSVVSTTSALVYPTGIAVDSSGKLYIADTGVGKILVETPSGELLDGDGADQCPFRPNHRNRCRPLRQHLRVGYR